MVRKKLTSFASGFALATVVTLGAASTALATHQWSKYHWERDGGPLSLVVGDHHQSTSGNTGTIGTVNFCNSLADGCPNWSILLQTGASGSAPTDYDSDGVIREWNGSGTETAPDELAGHFSIGFTGSSENIGSYNDDYGDSGWLGIASIYVTRGKNKHIVEGESKVNDYYVPEPFLGGEDYQGFNEEVEWLAVLCQEIGHDLGLGHTSGDTCMNTATRPLRNATPNTHDYDQLIEMYTHDHGDGGDGGGGGGGGGPGGCHPVFGCATVAHVVWAESYETEEDMFDAADLVVGARVLSSGFSHSNGRGAAAVPITQVRLRVTDEFKGFAPRVILLEQTRGPGLELLDDPGYVTGDDYVLYLRETGPSIFRTVNPEGRIRQ